MEHIPNAPNLVAMPKRASAAMPTSRVKKMRRRGSTSLLAVLLEEQFSSVRVLYDPCEHTPFKLVIGRNHGPSHCRARRRAAQTLTEP